MDGELKILILDGTPGLCRDCGQHDADQNGICDHCLAEFSASME